MCFVICSHVDPCELVACQYRRSEEKEGGTMKDNMRNPWWPIQSLNNAPVLPKTLGHSFTVINTGWGRDLVRVSVTTIILSRSVCTCMCVCVAANWTVNLLCMLGKHCTHLALFKNFICRHFWRNVEMRGQCQVSFSVTLQTLTEPQGCQA